MNPNALAEGIEIPLLMAGGEPEARIHARNGYERIGEILFIDQPKPQSIERLYGSMPGMQIEE